VASAETDWETACVGSGRYVPLDHTELSLEGRWIAECPDCAQSLELGYAGFLPVHAGIVTVKGSGKAGSSADEASESGELATNLA
jgi:hypothetical protein